MLNCFSEAVMSVAAQTVAAQKTWKNVKEIHLVHNCTVAHFS